MAVESNYFFDALLPHIHETQTTWYRRIFSFRLFREVTDLHFNFLLYQIHVLCKFYYPIRGHRRTLDEQKCIHNCFSYPSKTWIFCHYLGEWSALNKWLVWSMWPHMFLVSGYWSVFLLEFSIYRHDMDIISFR